MFLWHVEPICFTDFQKGRDIDKRWGWFKKGGWTPFSELCFFSFDLSTTNVLSCRNQSIDLQTKSIDWFLHDRTLVVEGLKVLIRYNYVRFLISSVALSNTWIYCSDYTISTTLFSKWSLFSQWRL